MRLDNLIFAFAASFVVVLALMVLFGVGSP